MPSEYPGSEFRVSVSGFGVRVSDCSDEQGFGFGSRIVQHRFGHARRVSGLRDEQDAVLRVWGFGFQISGSWFRSRTGLRGSGFRVWGSVFKVSSFRFGVSG